MQPFQIVDERILLDFGQNCPVKQGAIFNDMHHLYF